MTEQYIAIMAFGILAMAITTTWDRVDRWHWSFKKRPEVSIGQFDKPLKKKEVSNLRDLTLVEFLRATSTMVHMDGETYLRVNKMYREIDDGKVVPVDEGSTEWDKVNQIIKDLGKESKQNELWVSRLPNGKRGTMAYFRLKGEVSYRRGVVKACESDTVTVKPLDSLGHITFRRYLDLVND